MLKHLTAGAAIAALALAGGQALAQAKEITIAVAGPMTGQYAAFGEQMKRGAEMAVKDLNAVGGVGGMKIKLEIGDDACDPKQAVAVANSFVSKKVAFVGGHFCSGSSIPASEVYNEAGIMQISPASTNPKFTDDAAQKKWMNVARVCGRDDYQGITAGNYIADKMGDKKVAILHDKSAYGKGLADEFKKQFNKRGKKEVMYEAYTQGDKDFNALVSKMKAAAVDVIYVGGYHTEAGLIVRQAREQGMNTAVMVSGDALVTDEFWKISGPAGQGTLMTFEPDPRKYASAAAVVEKFKAQKFDPEGYTLYTYAAIQVWAQAVNSAKSTKVADLSKNLREKTFDTVLGKLQFDAKGDRRNPQYVFYVWKDGKYAQM
ncbi:MAG: branched-chain amino acid ABC transporter substrate-binding protein [Alphaproteobacteria bacterium]|nr:branched-chain amino acid ABC transporter substrate-binding protein [Alphaproteobacteria bacterium]